MTWNFCPLSCLSPDIHCSHQVGYHLITEPNASRLFPTTHSTTIYKTALTSTFTRNHSRPRNFTGNFAAKIWNFRFNCLKFTVWRELLCILVLSRASQRICTFSRWKSIRARVKEIIIAFSKIRLRRLRWCRNFLFCRVRVRKIIAVVINIRLRKRSWRQSRKVLLEEWRHGCA